MDNKWNILDIYYKSTNYYISNVQLDTFNDFVRVVPKYDVPPPWGAQALQYDCQGGEA